MATLYAICSMVNADDVTKRKCVKLFVISYCFYPCSSLASREGVFIVLLMIAFGSLVDDVDVVVNVTCVT